MGTLINVGAIILGGLIGLFSGSRFLKRMQETLIGAVGVSTMFLGISGAMEGLLKIENGSITTQGTMMLIGSMAIGSILGEWINLEDRMQSFGEWLKQKSGNADDQAFVNAFVTASLTVCIGAMAVVGSIEDGVQGDYSILAAKAVLDFMIILIMTAAMGKGCVFSALPVGIFEGVMTLAAHAAAASINETMIGALSTVGSVLIFCVGVNLLFGHKIRVANLLPALVIAMFWSILA
ncbi:DUF554 domain-containing protein [Anaerolactibacter massiliensis]|uniref:DUF554 domain-containing protein n=1 Tax=Anaerolactibacter massiliensis TaxID=2044573 RepID=UPI000CF9FE30|nr:DUF554 domain-containing protein [Anaerolactibacter massiliensis]